MSKSEGLSFIQLQEENAKLVTESLKVKAERDALAAEAAYLRDEIKQHSECTHFCEVCGKDDPCKNDDVCWALNHPMPTTDAFLNSVRADAVNHAGKMIMVTMNHQDKGVERALECLAEVELQYVLAARLRAGKDGE